MPKASVFCVVLAWLVALAGAVIGINLFWNGHLDSAVIAVVTTLATSVALVAAAVWIDPRCDGYIEVQHAIDYI